MLFTTLMQQVPTRDKKVFTINEEMNVIVISKQWAPWVYKALKAYKLQLSANPRQGTITFKVRGKLSKEVQSWLAVQYAEFRAKHVKTYSTQVRPLSWH